MELDFEPGDVVEASLGKPLQYAAIKMPGRERHRLAVGEIDVAQHPTRPLRPRQHAEGQGIGDHQEVAAALHLRHAEPAAGGENRKHRFVRGVLGKQRGGDGAAVAHRGRGLARHHGFSAQNAVLVGKRQADDLESLFLDPFIGAGRRLELLVAPQAVALDEAARRSFLR
jgi:hypothetical protein